MGPQPTAFRAVPGTVGHRPGRSHSATSQPGGCHSKTEEAASCALPPPQKRKPQSPSRVGSGGAASPRTLSRGECRPRPLSRTPGPGSMPHPPAQGRARRPHRPHTCRADTRRRRTELQGLPPAPRAHGDTEGLVPIPRPRPLPCLSTHAVPTPSWQGRSPRGGLSAKDGELTQKTETAQFAASGREPRSQQALLYFVSLAETLIDRKLVSKRAARPPSMSGARLRSTARSGVAEARPPAAGRAHGRGPHGKTDRSAPGECGELQPRGARARGGLRVGAQGQTGQGSRRLCPGPAPSSQPAHSGASWARGRAAAPTCCPRGEAHTQPATGPVRRRVLQRGRASDNGVLGHRAQVQRAPGPSDRTR